MHAVLLTPLGELRDPAQEQRFREAQLPLAARHARRNALIAGCAYMSGAVPFGWAFGLTPAYHVTNVGRLLVLMACLVLAFHPATARDRRALERASVVVAVVAALALLAISALTPLGAHGNGTLAVAVMVVVALFVEVPIRWAAGVVTVIAGQTLAVNHWVLDTPAADAGLVAIVVVPIGLMSILAASRLGGTQRRLVASMEAEHAARLAADRHADGRAQAEFSVRDRDRALLSLVQHAPLPLVIADRETGCMIAANQELRTLLDIPADREGVPLRPYAAPAGREQLAAALSEGRPVSRMNMTLVSGAGRVIEAQLSAVVATVGDRRCAVVSILDLTAEREHARTLQQAREAADASSRAKSEFLAHMSHEIRTPMSGVLGLAELLLDSELTSDQRELVHTIRSSGALLLEVINGILDLSKVESAAFELERREFDPVEALERSFEPLALEGRHKGLRCALAYGPDVPPLLTGDEVRVRQIFNNLVGNAIKFTQRGEVVVYVDVAREGQRPRLSIEVRDTGVGLDAAASRVEDPNDHLRRPPRGVHRVRRPRPTLPAQAALPRRSAGHSHRVSRWSQGLRHGCLVRPSRRAAQAGELDREVEGGGYRTQGRPPRGRRGARVQELLLQGCRRQDQRGQRLHRSGQRQRRPRGPVYSRLGRGAEQDLRRVGPGRARRGGGP